MGLTVSNETQSTPFSNETWFEEASDYVPGLKDLFDSDEILTLKASYFSFISNVRLLSSCLSVPCIFYNIILLVVLLSDNDFSSWQFFPMMLQCGVDAIGPGLANIIYNYQVSREFQNENNMLPQFVQTQNKLAVPFLSYFGRYDGYDACVWTYLREILNELSTGICVCATGFYRYLLVCHPTYKVEDNFYKKGAIAILIILILEIGAVTADLAFNGKYDITMDIAFIDSL